MYILIYVISSLADRYHVASINWRRVENPFIVCVWILFAGLAKIGNFHFIVCHFILCSIPSYCYNKISLPSLSPYKQHLNGHCFFPWVEKFIWVSILLFSLYVVLRWTGLSNFGSAILWSSIICILLLLSCLQKYICCHIGLGQYGKPPNTMKLGGSSITCVVFNKELAFDLFYSISFYYEIMLGLQ